MSGLQLYIVPLALILIAKLYTGYYSRKQAKLPPGPPGSDHTNLLQGRRWDTFNLWKDQYG